LQLESAEDAITEPQQAAGEVSEQHIEAAHRGFSENAGWDTHQLDVLNAQRVALAADCAMLQPDEEQVIADFFHLEAAAAEETVTELGGSRLTWWEVGQLSVCELIPHSCTVMQAAYSILHNMISTSSTFDAASRNLDFIVYSVFAGTPSPDNPHNRFPPSLHICYQIVGVKEISDFVVHMCPKGCMHWWTHFVHASEHKGCQGCPTCRCPHCHGSRFHQVRGTWLPAHPVYYFPDVFEQFFLNRHWYDEVKAARQAKSAPWYKSPEYCRLEKFFEDRGIRHEVRLISLAAAALHCQCCCCDRCA
jgi:hypothetical protein